jgi:hypothetical protein
MFMILKMAIQTMALLLELLLQTFRLHGSVLYALPKKASLKNSRNDKSKRPVQWESDVFFIFEAI